MRAHFAACILAFWALPADAYAQGVPPAPSEEEGEERVVEVVVEGLRRVEREAALTGVKSRAGAVYDPEQITKDLRAIWATGFFRDVRAERETVPGGVRVIFVVVERPSIREVRFLGQDDVSEEDIKGVVDVKPYTILNVDNVKKNVDKIKDLYVQKGFYLAEVSYRVDPVEGKPGEVDVTFVIVENAKVVVKEVAFIGNKHVRDDDLKAAMQTREGDELSWLTQSGTYKEEYFQTDLFRIQALYYDRGYVAVKVGEPTATISPDRRYIYLMIPITEGERYDIGEIRFSGDVELRNDQGEVVVDADKLKKRLRIKQSETFNRTKLFEDIQAVTDVYRDEGYAYANVTPNSAIRPDVRQVDLDLEVERGEIVYFERIEVAGNTRTRDKVIRREMRIFEGEKYSARLMNESRARIFALGHFETVNLTTSKGSQPNQMNVTVEVKEKSTGTFQVGAGFSSLESFILTAQISNNNFLGNGWLLSLSAQLSFGSFARRLATLQFFDPYFLDTNWSLGIDAYSTQRYYNDFVRNSIGGSPRLGYSLTPDLRVSLGYTLEQIDISTNQGTSVGPALDLLNADGLNSAINVSVTYDTRDNRLFPSKGMYHVLTFETSNPALGTSTKLMYNRAEVFTRFYYPLFWQFVLKFNADIGYAFRTDDALVPISERFFPGGIYSVRGFTERGLGPTLSTLSGGTPNSSASQFIIGGDKQAVFNLELEFPIVEAAGIKGVLFADAGNAYLENENLFSPTGDPNCAGEGFDRRCGFLIGSGEKVPLPLGLYYSFGFGFRWFSPIGPLRFEWGIPITKRLSTDRNLIFQFTIGNFF